jgi:Complex 1 protein (LYR family)
MARSKISRQVLALYKEFMVAAKTKPGFQAKIRQEFKNHSDIPVAESLRIEFLIRRGKHQLETIRNPNARSLQSMDLSPKTDGPHGDLRKKTEKSP